MSPDTNMPADRSRPGVRVAVIAVAAGLALGSLVLFGTRWLRAR